MTNADKQKDDSRREMYSIGYVFMIVNCVLLAIFILPLLYLIPMTIFSKKHLDNIGTLEDEEHLAFAICCLIFCNLVSGILFLIASVRFQPKK